MKKDPITNKDDLSKGGIQASLLRVLGWGIIIILIGFSVFLLKRNKLGLATMENTPGKTEQSFALNPPSESNVQSVPLKEYQQVAYNFPVTRKVLLDTIIPNVSRRDVVYYTVAPGDSVFAIAKKNNLKPESVLWANYDQLKDNPHAISVGMKLKIPPVDGVLYTWQEGDRLDTVANEFDVSEGDILGWTGNKVDLTNPEFEAGELVMIPGGHREFQQWLIPTIPRGHAGVSSGLYGSGACSGSYDGAVGDGAFIWPTENHTISGNDYWSGHLAIDIGAPMGASVVAADSGVIVFAGWANGGYGNMVMIDHGNGYQTLYAHLSSVVVHCGQSVMKGQLIARSGSTGNSTGPHLHFEVRYQGGFVNPWYVLPAP